VLTVAKPKGAAELFQNQEVITSELAAILGKTPQGIRQLTRDKVLVQSGRGKYVLGESVQAYIEHTQGGKEETDKPRFIDEKTDHERIKKERAALELARMRGEMHMAEDVEAVMSDMLAAFRQKILSVPTRLAPQLAGIEEINVIKGHLTRAMHEALSELSDYDPGKFKNTSKRADLIEGS
jgi:phage terminase Nu1 subunit (DNA packaging protein)